MTVTQEQEIARYVDRVRQALADLPPTVRDELVEDLPEHLAEVAAEGTGPLTDRLGPPEAYAAELRAAANVGRPVTVPNLDERISAAVVKVRARLRVIDTRTGPIIGYAKASDFLRLLRPGWWVLRGYLAAMLVTMVLGSASYGLLLLAMTVLGSIWLGRHSGGFSRWPRLAVHAGGALAIVFGLVMLTNVNIMRYGQPDYQPAYNPDPYSHVQDVYVYDGEGRLLEGVRLFDQNGQPIRLGRPDNCRGFEQDWDDWNRRTYPYCPERAPFRLGPVPSVAAVPPSSPAPSGSPTTVGPSPSVSPSR